MTASVDVEERIACRRTVPTRRQGKALSTATAGWGRSMVWCLLWCLVLVGTGCRDGSQADQASAASDRSPKRQESFRTKYNALLRTRNYDAAERLVVSRLASRPNDLDSLILAARLSVLNDDLQSAGERFSAAAELASASNPGQADAILLEWTVARCNGGEIMAAIDDLSGRSRLSVQQTRLLAQLLTIVGDMRGARLQYQRLMSQGVLQSGESYQLACEVKRPHRKPEWLAAAAARHPEDLRPQMAVAVDAYENGEEDVAIEQLDAITQQHPEYQPALGFLVYLLADTGQTNRVGQVLQAKALDSWDHPSLWYGWGLVLLDRGATAEAAACLSKAVELDPSGHLYTSRLATTLSRLGVDEVAEIASSCASRTQELRLACRAFSYDEKGSQKKCVRVVKALASLGRSDETAAWIELAKTLPSEPVSDASGVLSRLASRAATQDDLAAQLISRLDERFDLDELKPLWLGESESREIVDADARSSRQPADLANAPPIVFSDEAGERGLDFRYDHGETDGELGRWIYQTTGGGIAVGDFDLDGFEDVFFTQAGERPTPSGQLSADAASDALYWNRAGKFVVADQAGMGNDRGYGQGVAAGDINGDGFYDLFIGNIGRNRLLINRGDGTFVDRTDQSGIVGNDWTSSVAIVDLNADGLGDVVEVNYCESKASLERMCRDSNGELAVCIPVQFAGSVDRLWISRGDGTFTLDDSWSDVEQRGRGLGILAANLDEDPGVEVFVSNDMSSNHFWKRDLDGQWSEQAISRGLAVGADGRPQACMGIGWADLNRDQQLDFMVTNYSNESNALYMQSQAGFFLERSTASGLLDLSFPMLGFGTVIADFNHDGYEDAFIANGRVTRNEGKGEPFRQPAQALHWNGVDRWQDANPGGDYFSRPHTGRTATVTDIDNDGRLDIIVGHLGEPTALLMGRSEMGRVMSLELVGVSSARDAIGAVVRVETNRGTQILQNVGGDGYFTTQSPRLQIVLADEEILTGIEIDWPSGAKTRWETGSIGCRITASENGEGWISPLATLAE